ncbi:peptide chain release factor N(5)-glutamine methyltransferase [Thiomicrorhabdus sp. 6S3-12]|uniref:peptide chain release factor N(5)-glutamine methyltransferase n=1 Tax=Thiomicrorhabdus sp. 6S3-12 TaxID=2819681 RepID=UPI001AACDE5A|nr:peptide chain release factor N(5)-glutamine methyltransferase [Thiomicrorhabdus sp. 6S3-12]MBO1923153.1 peptide chain release factor N(5)-glutamine methyltransferase [Thiomicrorhabdus sp. 6S3-12]
MPSAYTIQRALLDASGKLAACNFIDNPKLEAEILLGHVLGCTRSYFYTWPEKPLSTAETEQFQTLYNLRLTGQPIAHIIGNREFWGLELKVTADTLIPRPDTETLIETALELLPATPQAKILDLGTGSGAIALALKSELPQAEVSAIDFSPAALEVAKENAKRLNLPVTFMQGSWCQPLAAEQRFNLIASNPPYIEEQDPHLQQGDVRFEPLSALTSGRDGLNDIRLIAEQAQAHLQDNGWLIVEHGYNQAQAVQEILQQNGYQQIQSRCDYGGNQRITFGQKTERKREVSDEHE